MLKTACGAMLEAVVNTMSSAATRLRVIALGAAVTGLLTAGALAGLGGRLSAAEPAGDADRQKPAAADCTDTEVRVTAPGASVSVDKESGGVSVSAPHTDVQVDPNKRRVRVRAPYVNLDIDW